MNSEWRQATLGECVVFCSGSTPSKANPDFWNGDIPWISAKDMKSFWVEDSQDKLTYNGAQAASRIVPAGTTLLLTRGMTLHNDIPIVRTRKPATFNQDVKALFPKEGVLNDFIPYLLLGIKSRIQAIVDSAGHGTGRLGTDQLRALAVVCPPKSDQAELAIFLGALDDRIALLRETNTTLEAIAQALFKSWFVDFDPVRAKQEGRMPKGMDEATAAMFPASFEESEYGAVPKGWRASTLGSICSENRGAIQTGPFGSQLHASDYRDAGVPVVMPQDLAGRRVQVEKIARVGDADASRLIRHQLKRGDIVFSRRGDVGRHALVGGREVGWLCGTGCLLVRPGQSWPSFTYLSLALDRTVAKEWLLRHAVGATMPNLNTGILSAVPIMRPDDRILLAFDAIVRALDERISHGHAHVRTLVDLRDTLLPRLISGRLHLSDAFEQMKHAA